MGYRGEDLDLRTPLAGRLPAAAGPADDEDAGARGGPIWVNDALLDCSNHAFDIAAAHRTAEVGLAHLLFAMTHVEAAVEALEARGIRVPVLRREAATEIVSEGAATLPNGKGTPRRSDDFEEALRLAALRAGRRNAPAGIDDALDVLADAASGLAGRFRLRPAVQRLVAAHLAASHPVRGYDLRRPLRTEIATREGVSHNSRLDTLEGMVRALSTNLASERQVLSGVLHELQREIMAQRDDGDRLGGVSHDRRHGGGYGDRMEGLEHGLLASRPSLGADVSLLHDRLGSLEQALHTELAETRLALETLTAQPEHAVDLAPILSRLDSIEEALLTSDAPQRLKTVEEALAAAAEAHETLMDEMKALAASVERVTTLPAPWPQEASDRFGALERTVAEGAERMTAMQSAAGDERATFAEALVKLNANQHTLAESIGTWRTESGQAVTAFGSRLETLERTTMNAIEMIEEMSGAVDRLHKAVFDRLNRRSRFWRWLFGTDDWIAASWPSRNGRRATSLSADLQD